MARRGKLKCFCDTCKQLSDHQWVELNHAAGLKCPNCGARVKPISEQAKKHIVIGNTLNSLGKPASSLDRQALGLPSDELISERYP